MRPRDVLTAGARELDKVLRFQGFAFRITDEGRGSGGLYASGEYRRSNRWLELHFRWSLGLVAYHVGSLSLAHSEYVRAVQAAAGTSTKAAYPGFSDDPLDGFRHLAYDLEQFGRVFCAGSEAEFEALHAWVVHHPRPTGLSALP
jgi:hypothetical protein